MMKIGIILGSTRTGRLGESVATWVHERARDRPGAEYELVDLADHPLPHLEAATPASRSRAYPSEQTAIWSSRIRAFDGHVFVTPEYNHSIPGVLKNAIDHLYPEWNNKAAGIVSYGGWSAGTRAAEQLRLILAEVRIATVRDQVALSTIHDFEDRSVLRPSHLQPQMLDALLDEVESWSRGLASIRTAKGQPA